MHKDQLLPDIITFLYEKLILPRTAKRATRIICASNFIKDTILQKYMRKSTTVHPGADIDLFKCNPIVEREENLVLFVCSRRNMYKLKGLYFLIEALRDLPHARLRVIGEKDDFADGRIVSVGVKRGKDLVEEMQKASAVVLPSLAKEGFPMVLVEAMACQAPVIGTDRGGIPEVIRDGIDGFVVPAKDSKALSLAISKILADKELANRMGNSGETRVRKMLTWDSRIALTKEVFVSCLK
jgi:glycosyltransferase involved in cell wall biosynthesis